MWSAPTNQLCYFSAAAAPVSKNPNERKQKAKTLSTRIWRRLPSETPAVRSSAVRVGEDHGCLAPPWPSIGEKGCVNAPSDTHIPTYSCGP